MLGCKGVNGLANVHGQAQSRAGSAPSHARAARPPREPARDAPRDRERLLLSRLTRAWLEAFASQPHWRRGWATLTEPLMLLPQHLAQCGAGVFAAHPSPPLQLRYDMVHKRLDGAGAIDG